MADYIIRDDVLKAIDYQHEVNNVFESEAAYVQMWETINDDIGIKSADVQPVKRGHWESSQYLWETGQTRCSNCMAEFYADDLMCISGDDKNIPDFCPCCGADMRNE